jgi:membrane-associated phospholipid phosphatase
MVTISGTGNHIDIVVPIIRRMLSQAGFLLCPDLNDSRERSYYNRYTAYENAGGIARWTDFTFSVAISLAILTSVLLGGAMLLVYLAVMMLIVLLLKVAVRERRPDGTDCLSFPSGHTASAAFCATVLAGLLLVSLQGQRKVGRKRRVVLPVVAIMLVAWAGLVGYSRIALHRHHLHDVVAGGALGAAAGLAFLHKLI